MHEAAMPVRRDGPLGAGLRLFRRRPQFADSMPASLMLMAAPKVR